MATLRQDLGPVTAYAYAVSEGYTGTEEEFAEVLANFADSAEQVAADAAQVALDKGAVHDDKEAVDSAEGRVTSAVNTFTTTTAPNAVTAVENAGAAQIGLVEAEGTRQIGLVADKGTEQVGTVSSEGTTQIGLVEAKGAEVIASIPGDYSTLQGDIASTYSSSSTYAVGDYVLYSGQLYRCTTAISTPEAWTSAKWTAVSLGDDVGDLKSAFDNIETAFVAEDEPLTLSSFTRGKFITANGTEDTLNNVEYASVIIDESTVGKQLLISGSAWYSSVKPYVFVASNDAKQVADVPNPGSTPTQYTDIPFTPNTTGTLYLNRYNNTTNNVQVAKAIYRVLTSIKGDYLPEDVGDYVYDATNYTGINFETVSNKMLKGTTGVITDESNSNYRVTEYIDIHAYSKLMITACNFYSYGLYSFYDSNKTYISNSGKDAASGSTVTKIYNETVNVPDGAKYIVIGFLYNHMATPYLFGAVDQSILPSKRWDELKWVCVGDSLTAYNDATAFHYFDYIRANSGIDVINMGVGGTGYMRGADNSNAFYQRVLSIANDCDVCTVFGSGNDLSLYESIGDYTDTGTTTICGCVNTFLDNYFSICPTAPIGIIAPTPWMSYPTTMVTNNHMDDYVEKLQKIANYRGVPFLDLYHGSNLRPENETNRNACFYNESSLDGNGDGVHPNELGHRIIAPKIYEFLKTLLLD